jgi:hypothetical protein
VASQKLNAMAADDNSDEQISIDIWDGSPLRSCHDRDHPSFYDDHRILLDTTARTATKV